MLKFQYWHVKCHQDMSPNHHLTIKEQHNVDCDKLAKTFVHNHPLCSIYMATPEFAVAEAHLKDGQVICQQVLLALWQAAAAPANWDYLHKCFTWTHSDLRNIRSEMLKTSLNPFLCNDQCQLVLFMHNKLALHTSKFHLHPGSQLCPSCQCDPEDRWHFFECQHPKWCHLFSNLKQSLAMIMTKHSLHPAIFTTFWLGLLTICNNTPYPDVSDELPLILSSTITAQTRLGWDQLYHGRVSHLWETAIDQLNPHSKLSGHFIVTQMIKMIWTYILAIWTMCNHHLHQDSRRLSLPNYQQAVKMIYKLQSQLPPEVQDALFQCPLDQMLEQPPRSCAPGLSAVNAVFNNNWKLLKSTQNSKHLIFICYLEVQTHQWMIYNHSRNPYITAPVWVFCVQLSQRVITLKDQVCCCCWWWCCWLLFAAVVGLFVWLLWCWWVMFGTVA